MVAANQSVRYTEIFQYPGATNPSAPSTGKTITVKALPVDLTNTNFAQFKVWVGPAATAVAYPLTGASVGSKSVSIAVPVAVTTATQIWIGKPIVASAGLQIFFTRASVTIAPGTLVRFGVGREFFSASNYTYLNSNAIRITPSIPTGSPSIGQTTLYLGGVPGAVSDSITLAQNALGGPQKPLDFLAVQENNPFLKPYAGAVGVNGLPTFPLLSSTADAKATLQITGALSTGAASAPTSGYFDFAMYGPTTNPTTGVITQQFRRYYFNHYSQISSNFHTIAVVAAYNMVSVTTGSTTVTTNQGSAVVDFYSNVPINQTASIYDNTGTWFADVLPIGSNTYGYPNIDFFTRDKSQSTTNTIVAAAQFTQNRSIAGSLTFTETLTVTPHLVVHVYNVATSDTVTITTSIGATAGKYKALTSDALAFSESISTRGKTLIGNTSDVISFSDRSALPMVGFTTPKTKVVPPILPDTRGPAYLLFRHYEIRERHVNVFKLKDGTFVQDYPTPENSNANVPYPYNPNDPTALYAYVHNWDGSIQEFHLPNPIVQVFLGGETTMVSQAIANELIHAGYGAYLEPMYA